MFRRFMRFTVIILLAAVIMTTAGCDIFLSVIPSDEVEADEITFEPADETDIVGDIQLLLNENQVNWKMADEESTATLQVSYEEISLTQVMAFLDGLENDGWYLTGISAYNGARYADISYSMDTRRLDLKFTYDKAASEWPEGALAPYLANTAPPFPYGKIAGYAETEYPWGNAEQIVYKDVTKNEMGEYTALLKGIADQQGTTNLFYIDRLFIYCEYDDGEARINVGMNDNMAAVPLPPWPDLPDFLQRILPTVSAVMTVNAGEDGAFISAEQTSLSDLHSFFKSALEYGWSPISDPDKDTYDLEYPEYNVAMFMQSYSTSTQVWTLSIYDAWEAQPDATEPETTASDEIGISEYGYTLTAGKYSEESAMMGVLDEFGQYADMADWNEIVSLYGNDFTAFLKDIGVKENEDVWVMLDGKRENFGRYYFLAFVNGKPRDDFVIMAQVGDEAWLGLWYDLELRVLVKAPSELLP